MTLRDKTRRWEGPLMAFVLAGSLAGLTYIVKDYFDSQERNLLYSGMANARTDERTRATKEADRRLEEMRDYYASLNHERDERLQQLTDQNRDMFLLNQQILQLVQAGQKEGKKSLAAATIAATKATQAAQIADTTSKTLTNVVSKEKVPEASVKKLNEKIKDTNRK